MENLYGKQLLTTIARSAIIFFLFASLSISYAQDMTQTVRGKVLDKESQIPLIGANVIILNTDPIQGASTDTNGLFRIEKVALGRHNLKTSYIGYNEVVLPDVIVSSGKEVILTIELEEAVLMGKEVVITATQQKDQVQNEMSTVSARTFTIDETQRYAGSLGDPARLVANFAGVTGANDQRNDIIVRGNSPTSVGWRLEGIDIPNPNHFGVHGTTGGPVSMINNNLLENSDFFTGAFPAEYGNAIASVFDLRLRNGNNEKHEFLGQVGFNGFELMSEGPLSRENKSSYIASYRYSTMGVFDQLGINIGVPAIPYYQDLTFKLNIPTKNAGNFKLFGLGGINSIAMLESKRDTTEWSYGLSAFDMTFGSKTGIVGLSHNYWFSNNSFSTFTLSTSSWYNGMEADSVAKISLEKFPLAKQHTQEDKYSASFAFTKKISSRNSFKAGGTFDIYSLNALGEAIVDSTRAFIKYVDFKGEANHLRTFVQWKHKVTEEFQLIPGLHYSYFLFNGSQSLEPRFGTKWNFSPTQALSFGYGLHSRLQPWPTYLFTVPVYNSQGKITEYITNNDSLDFTKSHQLVLGYDHLLRENLRLKVETYWQYLFDVPVEASSSYVSLLNTGADFYIPVYDKMENKGSGENYGVEMTVEKFFSKNYYFLLTGSVYESKYKGSDQVLRNTAFNGNYMFNLLGGKEFFPGKEKGKHTFAIDAKIALAGGKRYIPFSVELDTVRNTYYQDFDYDNAYSKKYPDYFRTDVRISYKKNSEKITQQWALDLQNLTNHKNYFVETIDKLSGKVRTEYQLGFFPMMLYKINF